MEHSAPPAPEFSRLIATDQTGGKPVRQRLTATTGECAALAQRFGVERIENLGADCTLSHDASADRVRLDVKFTADIGQLCVITLEPVAAHVESHFVREYSPAAISGEAREIIIDPDADDPPEALPEGGIDAGEAIAEQLGLEIDPFPRAPGAEFQDHEESAPADHPFAKLKNLKIEEC
jgi:uncharacterized metal-binding protein YceD (DUF177 family)